jgi:mRNA-degrading endonuclease toxin of MazEF toxin-antitoxin module
MPTEVNLGPADGLPSECVVNLDNIHAVRKSRISDRIASLDDGKMVQVEQALLFALGMERYAR